MHELDIILHFGYMPWEITHYLFSTSSYSAFINVMYGLWFFILWVFVCSVIFLQPELRLKLAIISAFNISWVVNGSLFALIFSSVGPVYISNVFSEIDAYSPLFDILNSQNEELVTSGYALGIPSLEVQNWLWDVYVKGEYARAAGISAFPSMHVSIAALFFFVLRDIDKRLGIIFFVYLIFIQIGSIHLGWHYAIDGYFSIFTTGLIWILMKKIFKINYAMKVISKTGEEKVLE
ncbi:phosphatase PAP2 family protein [Vibrio breoganii]